MVVAFAFGIESIPAAMLSFHVWHIPGSENPNEAHWGMRARDQTQVPVLLLAGGGAWGMGRSEKQLHKPRRVCFFRFVLSPQSVP